jgi:hypothetical protein
LPFTFLRTGGGKESAGCFQDRARFCDRTGIDAAWRRAGAWGSVDGERVNAGLRTTCSVRETPRLSTAADPIDPEEVFADRAPFVRTVGLPHSFAGLLEHTCPILVGHFFMSRRPDFAPLRRGFFLRPSLGHSPHSL